MGNVVVVGSQWGDEGKGKIVDWLSERADVVVRFRSSSFVSMVSNLKAGLGVGPLPTIIGDAEPELVRCFPAPPELRDELWLIVREELKNEPHVRALTDFLASYVREAFADDATTPPRRERSVARRSGSRSTGSA